MKLCNLPNILFLILRKLQLFALELQPFNLQNTIDFIFKFHPLWISPPTCPRWIYCKFKFKLLVYYVPQQLEMKLQTDAFIFVGVDKIFKLQIKLWMFLHDVSYCLGQSRSFLWMQSMLLNLQSKHLEAEEIFRSTIRNIYFPKYSFFVGERLLNTEFASYIKPRVLQYGILFLAQDRTGCFIRRLKNRTWNKLPTEVFSSKSCVVDSFFFTEA